MSVRRALATLLARLAPCPAPQDTTTDKEHHQ